MTISSDNLLARKEYLSGTEADVVDKLLRLQLTNGETLAFAVNEVQLHELEALEGTLNVPSFERLVVASGLKKSALLGLYKNEDGLRTNYALVASGTYLVVLSLAEIQPARYALQLESVWRLSDVA